MVKSVLILMSIGESKIFEAVNVSCFDQNLWEKKSYDNLV